MTQQEMKKLRVIDQTIAMNITVKEAAGLLDLSERQVFRLKKGVKKHGAAFIIHKNRGRKPAHAIRDETKNQIIALKKEKKYAEANFTHFKELLEEFENINVSVPTIHRALTEAGIVSPKKKRKPKSHHRRKRKPQEGMMLQLDASPFKWFGDTDTSLHGYIDDATSKICGLRFEETECLKGYFGLTGQTVRRHGIPVCIYTDCHTIFRSPKTGKLSIEQQLKGEQVNKTQFGKAMEELGVTVKFAKSPQAKGRIERLWETLQSRLPVELALRGITTIEQANAFLPEYIDKLNELFAVEPEEPESAFRPLDSDVDLTTILCIKEQRTVSDGKGFSYCGQYYQLMQDGKHVSLPRRARITVLDSHENELRAKYEDKIYETVLLPERPKAVKETKKPAKDKAPVRPSEDHPWKAPKQKRPKLFYDESDREILEALFDSSRAWGGKAIKIIVPF